jgi:hypothetical protein
VGLSIVYPADDPLLPDELRRLRRALPDGTSVLLGGQAASSYLNAALEIGATVHSDLASLPSKLNELRARRIS